ncbi:hypothetical protein D4R75_02965 [bacterium]|nr:MAG: hypothetical protein D4R75_02965 [bacterium]
MWRQWGLDRVCGSLQSGKSLKIDSGAGILQRIIVNSENDRSTREKLPSNVKSVAEVFSLSDRSACF